MSALHGILESGVVKLVEEPTDSDSALAKLPAMEAAVHGGGNRCVGLSAPQRQEPPCASATAAASGLLGRAAMWLLDPEDDEITQVLPRRILVAEDNPVNQLVVQGFLKKRGYSVMVG